MTPIPQAGGFSVAATPLNILSRLPDGVAAMVYLDPPRGTGFDPESAGDAHDYRDEIGALLRQAIRVLAEDGNLLVRFPARSSHLDMAFLLRQLFNDQPPYVISFPAAMHARGQQGEPHTETRIIHLARASSRSTFRPPTIDRSIQGSRVDAHGREYRLDVLTIRGSFPNLDFEFEGQRPPPGQVWRFSLDRLLDFASSGLIDRSHAGALRLRRYLDELPPVEMPLEWDDVPPICPVKERIGAASSSMQEPWLLAERLVAMTCPEEGLVVVPFSRSVTITRAAAALGRRWIWGEGTGLTIDDLKTALESQGSALPTPQFASIAASNWLRLPALETSALAAPLVATAGEVQQLHAGLADAVARVGRLQWESSFAKALAAGLWSLGVPAVPEYRIARSDGTKILDFFLPAAPRGAVEIKLSDPVDVESGVAHSVAIQGWLGPQSIVFLLIPSPAGQAGATPDLPSGIHLVHVADGNAEAAAGAIAETFKAATHTLALPDHLGPDHAQFIADEGEFSTALSAISMTYESLFGTAEREVLQHEMRLLRGEIEHEHFTAAALRVGRSLEFIVYASCTAWGIPVREPVLVAVQRLEGAFKALRSALIDLSTVDKDSSLLAPARARVKKGLDGLASAATEVAWSFDPSEVPATGPAAAPRNLEAMLADVKRRHARLEVVRDSVEALTGEKGTRPVRRLLDLRNHAAHASLDGQPREVSESDLRSMLALVAEVLDHLAKCGLAILSARGAGSQADSGTKGPSRPDGQGAS